MKFFKFDKNNGKRVSTFDFDFIVNQIVQTEKPANIAYFNLEEQGVIGYHKAVVPQLLLILNGEGLVRNGKNKYFKVAAGDAVYWEKDEWHETKSELGLIVIVIESEELNPSLFMVSD